MNNARVGSHGFTIIESVLFLAVSGIMIAGIIGATSVGINSRRYTEAVDSFQDNLIDQYAATFDVSNSQLNPQICNAEGTQPRGTQGCSIIGRYIIYRGGSAMTSQPIYAQADVTSSEVRQAASESVEAFIKSLKLVSAGDSSADTQAIPLRWNTTLKVRTIDGAGDSGTATSFALVILRLPYGKGSLTYIVRGGEVAAGFTGDEKDIIRRAMQPGVPDRLALCVMPEGLQSDATAVSVTVKNGGSGGSADLERRGGVCG